MKNLACGSRVIVFICLCWGQVKTKYLVPLGLSTLFIVSIGCDLRWNKPINLLSKVSFLSGGKKNGVRINRMESQLGLKYLRYFARASD